MTWKRRGRFCVSIAMLASLTTQCSPVGRLDYFHPSRSEQDLIRDEKQCRDYARSAFRDGDHYIEEKTALSEQLRRNDLRRDAFDDCMREKGWRRKR